MVVMLLLVMRLVVVVVVMTMVVVMVVVMMPITVGDDAIDGDVVGDDDGALNWGTCKCMVVWVHVLLFLPNSCKSPLNSPKYFFSILDPPLSGYCVRLSAIGW